MKQFKSKRIIPALYGALAATVVFAAASCSKTYPAKSETDIADFLAGAGITVTESCTHKTVTIPEEFGEVYERYNELQKEQGFDLTRYRNREAEVYTFRVVSVDGGHTDLTEAHVMVCDGIVIGADISSPAISGEMKPVISDQR